MNQTYTALDDIRAQAASLADPQDGRPAWVWDADGTGLLWANADGLATLELESLDAQEVIPSAPAARSLQAVARTPVGAAGRGRIEILRINAGGHQETIVVTCRPVMLGDKVAVLALGTASRARSTPLPDLGEHQEPTPDLVDTTHKETPPAPAETRAPDATDPGAENSEPADIQSNDPMVPGTEETSEPAFAFKPRSRPHRFSFMVNPSGRVSGLSSGLADAIGPANALRDGEVASEALIARLGDLPAAIFHGIDERRRFSEHEVLWPVSDSTLAVPVRLSAFDEDDGSLRVFGTVLTAKSVDRGTPSDEAAEPVMTPAHDETLASDHPPVEAPSEASAPPATVAPFAAAPLSDEHASAAGLFTYEPSAGDEDTPGEEPQMTMAAQMPGGATLAAAASALVAGIAQAMARPSPEVATPSESTSSASPVTAIEDRLEDGEAEAAGLWTDAPFEVQPTGPAAMPLPQPLPVTALEDSLDTDEAEAAGLWTQTPAPVDTPAPLAIPQSLPVTALDDSLDTDEAEAAGLWTPQPAQAVEPVRPETTDDTDFPAETVDAMKAVAAGIAAGLTGGVVGGVVSGAQREPAADEPADDVEDMPQAEDEETPAPESVTPAEDQPDLSRPERLTFQEIARRLGTRIVGRDDGDTDKGAGKLSLVSNDDSDELASPAPGDVITFSMPHDDEGEPEQDIEPQEGGRVVPFTRSEPNAERVVLDRLPLGIVIYTDDAILYGNRAALDLAGLESLQALKALGSIERLFAGGVEDSFNAADSNAGTMTILRPDGTRVAVSGRLQKVRWDNQSAALISLREEQVIGDGPSERETSPAVAPVEGANAADGALPLVRARIGELEAIIDLASDGVVTLDGSGEIKDLNQAAQALVGYAAEDLIGRPFRLLFPEDSRQTALDYLEDMASQGRLSLFNEGRELECITAQGGLVPVFMTLGRLTDDEPATYCAVLRDLSPFKQAETDLVAARKAAEEANAHKSEFLARVSHEIRTPLNAVIGFSEVMLEERFGPVGSERYRQYLRDIHTSGEHLMSLLNDLLDLSKIEAGKMELTFGEVDLNDVVQQCLAIMQPQANQGRIIVRTSLPITLPKVVADIRSVRQVVLNLMSNAIKFTDPGGQIIVSTLYEPSGEVSLRVRDTGRGMNEADVQLALEPFRQVPTTLNQVITGTGLGLPLTKALVEANRAQFALESTLGEGTLAMMTFPSQRVLAE